MTEITMHLQDPSKQGTLRGAVASLPDAGLALSWSDMLSQSCVLLVSLSLMNC